MHLRVEQDPEAGADQAQRQVENRNLRTFCREALAVITRRDRERLPPIRARLERPRGQALGAPPRLVVGKDEKVTDRSWLRQSDWDVRFEWGPAGVEAVAADAVVVVDVMRFTTAVDAAVSRGAVVFPCRWKDDAASDYAKRVGALLADPGDPMGPSLSPVSLLSLGPGDRIVLPSPNGSTCAAVASAMGATVLAGCLRNASAIGTWLRDRGGSVTVIACGERWPDGSLRPSLEDYLGAGAIVAALGGGCSPESAAAADAWRSAAPRVEHVLSSCSSGRELVARGWSDDLAFALAVDASTSVPVLHDGFVDANT